MKTSIPINNLLVQLQERRDRRHDYRLSGQKLQTWHHSHMDSDDQEIHETGIGFNIEGQDQTLTLNKHAHGQLANKYDVPVKYSRRIQHQFPELWQQTYQSHFNVDAKDRMVRCLDNRVRGFLAPNYAIRDNEPLLNALIPVLDEPGVLGQSYDIDSCFLDDDQMYIKITSPRLEGEVKVGDPVRFGVMIRNHETGGGSTSIEPFIKRLVCLNGMVRQDNNLKQRFRHVGQNLILNDDMVQLISHETLQLNNLAFFRGLQDLLRNVLSWEYCQRHLQQLQATTQREIPSDIKIPQFVERLEEQFSLTKDEGSSVLDNLIRDGDMTQWGVANAVTLTAESVESYDRATEFEKLGSRVVDLTPNQWETLTTV